MFTDLIIFDGFNLLKRLTSPAPVSLTILLCNFLESNLWVKPPHFTSGMMDSSHKWTDLVLSCSVCQLYTRKKILKARGSVGLTVVTVKRQREETSFVIQWSSPFDFNLYENSFAVFPLSSPLRGKESKQIYNEIEKGLPSQDDSLPGIRAFARDGPKAFKFRNILVSARLGPSHTDCLQISFIPLEQLETSA